MKSKRAALIVASYYTLPLNEDSVINKVMARKDEFTVNMHAEMLSKELSYIGVKSLEAYSIMLNEGLPVEEACKKAGISVEEYEKGRKEEEEWSKSAFL